MSKEITKAYILQEIQDKFKLRDFETETFQFLESVVPVYNIEQHLTTFVKEEKTIPITATGGKLLLVVPATERWRVHRYNLIFVTGSYKIAGLMVGRPNLAAYVYVDLTKNQTVSYAVNLPTPLILHSGDSLYVNIDDYTSTGDLLGIFDVEKEEIR